ncbi:hypothetical protein MAR_028276, partial [Mya arenaria]
MSCKENEVKKRMEKIQSGKERLELEINATFDRLKEKLEEMRGNTLQELADAETCFITDTNQAIVTTRSSEKTEALTVTFIELEKKEILNSKESCGRLRFEEYHYYEPINLENQKTEPYGSEDYYEFKAGANTDKDKSTKDGQDGPPPKSETPTPEVTELAKYKSHSYSLSDHSDFQKTPEFVEIILTSHGLVLLDSANGVLVLSDDKNGKIKNVVKVPFTLECITGVSSDRIAVLGKTKAETCIRVYKSSLNGLKEKPKESFKIENKCLWKREEKGKRSDFSPSNLALHGNKLYI